MPMEHSAPTPEEIEANMKPYSEPHPTARRLKAHRYSDIKSVAEIPQLIRGLIPSKALIIVFGDSNTGKSFVAGDAAFKIVTGQPWNGRRTEKSAVIYVAMEGGASSFNRVLAYKKKNPFRGDVPFSIIPSTVNMFDSPEDVAELIEVIKEEAEHFAIEVGLVIIDTLSRAMAGGNENASEDMGVIIQNADAVRAATGAALMLVHHTGKDKAKGARGHSSLRAATDTEIEISRDNNCDQGTIKVTKQRDMEGGQEFGFQLDVVEIGTDKYGEPITSCVIEWVDTAKTRAVANLTKKEKLAFRYIEDYFGAHSQKQHVMGNVPLQNACPVADVRRYLKDRGVTDRDKPVTERGQWKRINDGLLSKGKIEINESLMWLVKPYEG